MKTLPERMKKFCERKQRLRLSYIDLRGYPRVIPMEFVTIGNAYYVCTDADSPKWKAIKREPRIGWVIDGGSNGKGVSMFGKAKEVIDSKLRGKIFRALGKKYYGSADHHEHLEVWGDADDSSAVYLHLNLEGFFWWEF